MITHYILDGHKPVQCQNRMKWALWMSNPENVKLAKTLIGEVTVSTVFIGVDYGVRERPPVLFETMIFGGEYDQYQERYCAWDEAEAGHKRACELVTKDRYVED